MRHTMFIVFCLFNVISPMMGIYPVLAKAPTTAKIVFGSSRDGNREIYLMNPDGSEQINLTNHRADDVSPVFSPTGEQILFASDRDRFPGSWDLYLMDADGKNVRPVFEKSNDRIYPAWSPDGKQIAYERKGRGPWSIYVATINGRNEKRIAIGNSPSWSPNGRKLTFVVKAGKDRWEIHIFNMFTRKQKAFFPTKAIPAWIRQPAWSPAGDKLAFSWQNKLPLIAFENRETIYIVNRDSTELEQIVHDAQLGVSSPIWSPHGDALIYTNTFANYEVLS